jgi:outer membrane protein OmpA-like peptidoglycan-associated protein
LFRLGSAAPDPVPAPASGPSPDYAAFVAGPADEAMPDSLRIRPISPTNTLNGTRGLAETPAAEALGGNRLVAGLSGPWYRQERAFAGTPNRKADIFTGTAALAYGLGPDIDLFANLTGYSSLNYESSDATGLGTLGAGVQATLPLPAGVPIGLAAQVGFFAGLSGNPINRNDADGYNYFETRTGTDYRGLLIQSLVLGPERLGFKIHLNEGLDVSARDIGPLLLLAGGVQANLMAASLGLELHARTRARDVALLDDPLWVTPSVQVRTGWNVNLTAGADFALSRDRDRPAGARALEPWRVLGGIAFTLDTRWARERDAKWAALKAARAREREALAERERRAADSAEAARKAQAARSQSEAAEKSRLAEMQRARDSAQAAQARSAEQERLAKARSAAARGNPLEAQLLSGATLPLASVPFAPGKAEIAPAAKPYLDSLALILSLYPKLRYEVGGHADNTGSPQANQAVSQARARAVKNYLASKAASLAYRVAAVGYGSANPIGDNATAEGRAANRKADLKVANKAVLAEYARPSAPAGTAMGPEPR